MAMTLLVIVVVSASLLVGAAWGLYGKLPTRLQGFLVAVAGGALIVSVMAELIEPASEALPLWSLLLGVLTGALVFTVVDTLLDRHSEDAQGMGLLAAVTLDGIPENLALGVALIGAGVNEVAALAGSIVLSNLPEAAGGAAKMHDDGDSRPKVLGVWGLCALLLSAAALLGNVALSGAPDVALAWIKVFAAGAVLASLATEIFPQAYRDDDDTVGIAVALGVCAAYALHTLGG